jgi:hypothetical protein
LSAGIRPTFVVGELSFGTPRGSAGVTSQAAQ